MVGPYVRRVCSALTALAVAVALGGVSTAEAATVGTCTVVASPSAIQFTSCPDTHFDGPFPKPVDLSFADLPLSSFAPGPVTGLSGADVSNADLSRATLVGVDLSGTDLAGADLTDANLSHANLANASLVGAQLGGANLTDAVLTGADLTGASTTGATWSGTVCPDGANSDSVGGTCANDSAVESGFATGATQDADATATTTTTAPPQNSTIPNGSSKPPSPAFVPYTESTSGQQLAFTGAPVGQMAAIGLTLVGIGLLLCTERRPRRWRRSRQLVQVQ